MKNMKKFASLLLVVIMMQAMAIPAMAAPETTTISVNADDKRTYSVYQIFVGELATDGKTLSNVVWGKNGTGTENAKVDTAVLEELMAVNSAATDVAKLEVIKEYVDLDSAAYDTVSAAKSLNVPTGYYLLVDMGVKQEDNSFVVPEGEAKSLYVVQVVGPTTVTPKRKTVTSEKKVKDTNDTDGTVTEWQDSADYDVNDAVPFQLKGTVANDYASYEKYYFAFHDKQEAGLTFNKDSVKVYVDGTEITTGFVVKTEELTDDCTFEVIFADLKAISEVKADSVITVEYTSVLNNEAVIGSNGNANEMYLEYSNNPNTEEHGRTPKDKVIVFTYKVIVNKVHLNSAYDAEKDSENTGIDADGDKKYLPLEGAGFTLFKQVLKTPSTETVPAEYEWKQIGTEKTGEAMTQFVWERLDDGNYKLVETTTPNGYNTIADVEFTITADHVAFADNPALTKLESGNLFSGLVDTGALSADIENKSGTELPSTGGMGTTLFYIAGAILVVGAVVVMISKKRSSEK